MAFSRALSGGGCRGAAHIGVLLALEEAGLSPAALSGASAGAIIAGLYAYGYNGRDLETIALGLTPRLVDPDLFGIVRAVGQLVSGRTVTLSGLLRGERLHRWLTGLTGGMSIGTVRLPLSIAAVDLTSGETVAFCDRPLRHPLNNTRCATDLPLADAIAASCCVPVVFAPRKIGGGLFVDGGVTDNLPVDLLLARNLSRCPVVAIDLSSGYAPIEGESLFEVASHSLSAMSRRLRDCTVRGEQLLCRPRLPKEAGLFTFDRIGDCIEAGYRAAKELIPLIQVLQR